MQYSYLGSGQESGRSSVAQALGQTYSPLENIQTMSQEFVQQGLSNAGANYRAQLEVAGKESAYRMARQDDLKDKKAEARATKAKQIAYLGEMLAEQEMLIDAASQSGDPEQERRIPELQKNLGRVRRLLSLNPSMETLAGLLERNSERASMEVETAGARGGLRSPQNGGAKEPNKAKDGSSSDKKKEEGTRSLPSGRRTISLD